MPESTLSKSELEQVDGGIRRLQIAHGVPEDAVIVAAEALASHGVVPTLDAASAPLLADNTPGADDAPGQTWDAWARGWQNGLDAGRRAWNWIWTRKTDPDPEPLAPDENSRINPQGSLAELITSRREVLGSVEQNSRESRR